MTDKDLALAYKHSAMNRVDVLRSASCACFHCLSTFAPSAIKHWIDTGQTAVCPSCGMDSVLGSASGFELDTGFLATMKGRWFAESKTA
jgi:hypothetical protein